jgi:hypothetical protein
MINMSLFHAALVASLLALSACTGTAADNKLPGDPLEVMATFTVSDIQAALEDAQAHRDGIATTCYAELIEIVQAYETHPPPDLRGGFSAFQRARDLANHAKDGPIPKDVNIACAPLVFDAQQTVLRLGAILGVVGAFKGAVMPIPLAPVAHP